MGPKTPIRNSRFNPLPPAEPQPPSSPAKGRALRPPPTEDLDKSLRVTPWSPSIGPFEDNLLIFQQLYLRTVSYGPRAHPRGADTKLPAEAGAIPWRRHFSDI